MPVQDASCASLSLCVVDGVVALPPFRGLRLIARCGANSSAEAAPSTPHAAPDSLDRTRDPLHSIHGSARVTDLGQRRDRVSIQSGLQAAERCSFSKAVDEVADDRGAMTTFACG